MNRSQFKGTKSLGLHDTNYGPDNFQRLLKGLNFSFVVSHRGHENSKVVEFFFFVGPCVKQTALSVTLDVKMCADFKIYPSHQRITAIFSINAIIAYHQM